MTPLLILTIALLLLAIVLQLVLLARLRRQVARQKELTLEAEASKQQIIIEQERNRQLKQEMTSNIAHELKTPVSSILGFLEILLGDKPVEEAKRRYFLQRCMSQAERLSALIRDVSLINKMEEANDLFPLEAADITNAADTAISELNDKAAEKRIAILNDLPLSLPITGNKSLLYTIFRNLIENSIAYAGENATIGIECHKPADETFFYIHFYDTGIGVESQYLAKLFDRFLRIDEGRSRKNGGSGLGLSIVKHAVLFHGGEIYAKNREQGGLEFFFSISKTTARH